MHNVSTEKALNNQIASICMEGFSFSGREIDNVRRCLSGELTFKQFTDKIVRDVRRR